MGVRRSVTSETTSAVFFDSSAQRTDMGDFYGAQSNNGDKVPAVRFMSAPEISVVIPFYNEEQVAGSVIDEVGTVLARLARPYEIIAIDDGSADGTAGVLLEACHRWSACRVLRHARNAGQAAALWNGLHRARGTILATLDGDGQNDPADLPELLQRLGAADMVVGIRPTRRDSWLRRTMSRVANGIRRWWLRDGVSDTGCALKVFRREVLASFLPVRTLYSFIPAFAVRSGFRVVELPVRHRPRRAGTSNYGLLVMLWRPLVDMLAIGWLLGRRIQNVAVEEISERDRQ